MSQNMTHEQYVNDLMSSMDWERYQLLTFHKTIPALGNGMESKKISTDGHFECLYLGGTYTSLDAGPIDTGTCPVSVMLEDAGRHWKSFEGLIPMNLWASPGRVRSSGIAGDPSHPLFKHSIFEYTFNAGTEIEISYANSANYANEFWLLFIGERLFKNAPAGVNP